MLSEHGYRASGSIFNDSAEINIYENYNKAYFYLQDGNSGAYKFYTGLHPDQHYLIWTSDLNSNMVPHTINPPSLSYEYFSAHVWAYSDPGDYNYDDEILLFRDYYWDATPYFQFHYPSGHGAVQDFIFAANTYINDYISYYFTQAGPLPSSVPNMNTMINSVWLNLPDQVEASIIGTADIQLCRLLLEEDDKRGLSIYLRGAVGEALRIPSIPSGILAEYRVPAVSYSNLRVYYLTLREHSDADGYYPLANSLCGFAPFDPYYTPGTTIKDVEYYEYLQDKKGVSLSDREKRNHRPGPDGAEYPGSPPVSRQSSGFRSPWR